MITQLYINVNSVLTHEEERTFTAYKVFVQFADNTSIILY